MVRVNFCPFCGANVNEEVAEFKWHRLPCGHTVQAPFFFASRPAQDYIYCY